jgi:hypothetical protein
MYRWEVRMKFFIFVFCAILALSLSAFAQQDSTSQTYKELTVEGCQRALDAYLVSLNYENHGVVQSAIYNIMQIKCHYPQIDYHVVIHKLDNLTDHGGSHQIKAMALICSEYLRQKELSPVEKKEAKQIFTVLMQLPPKH